MMVYALRGPSDGDFEKEILEKLLDFLSNSIRNGVSRFGWSYVDSADLRKLQNKARDEMSEDERNCWRKSRFLLEIKKGDWVVHINIPYWGACIAGEVEEEYSFDENNNEFGDFRHTLKLKKDTIIEFERNDDRVLPNIQRALKLQKRSWRIYDVEDFIKTIENLKNKSFDKKKNETSGIYYLKEKLSPLLKDITKIIQKNHPAGKLEELIAEVFRRISNVIHVEEHGKHKGWGTDNGADLIVTYKSGLPIANLEKQEKLVVQIKSYEGQHWETNAVKQIENAIKTFEADAGLIITTAESTEKLEKAIEDLSGKLNKPVGLIAGEDVAKFVIKYGGDFLL
jgi:restriction endonuclease Mrr